MFNDSVSSFVVLFNTSPLGCRLPVSFVMGEDIDLLNPIDVYILCILFPLVFFSGFHDVYNISIIKGLELVDIEKRVVTECTVPV